MLKEFRKRLAASAREAIEMPLYSVGISAYRMGVKAAAIRNRKAKLLDKGQSQIWNTLKEKITPGQRYVWIHAASLGEFEQGRPIIEALKKSNPELKIVLTFFSPSGYEVRKNYPLADCICYLPFDTPRRVKKFIDIVNPEMAIFVKYEFWRNYLHELSHRGIPTYLVSAVFRPEQPFFKKRSAWYAQWLRWYTRIFVQDSRSRNLLEGIGIDNAIVAGDTRFDRVYDIMNARKDIPQLNAFAGKKGEPGRAPFVMMFGSSWPEDEAVYGQWLRDNPQVKAVIAPHEFNAARLEKLKQIVPGETVLMSELEENGELKQDAAIGNIRNVNDARVLVIDCFGLLSSAYAYADAAYVGGGFGVSIHNINEAAVYGIPVIFGPENHKFIEAQELKTLGGGIEVDGKSSFEHIASRLLHDPAELKKRGKWAGEYIQEKTGATSKILSSILKPSER